MRSIAADDVHLVVPVAFNGVTDHFYVEPTPRRSEYSAAFVVDILDFFLCESYDLAICGIEASVAERNSPNLLHAVQMRESDHQFSDDPINARAEPAARHNARLDLRLGVEREQFPRACAEKFARYRRVRRVGHDVAQDSLEIAHEGQPQVELRRVGRQRRRERADLGPFAYGWRL